jgi:hypothetical protein
MKMMSVTQTVFLPVCSTMAMTSRRIYMQVRRKVQRCSEKTYVTQSGLEGLTNIVVDIGRYALDSPTAS